jgi:hypothetical protein
MSWAIDILSVVCFAILLDFSFYHQMAMTLRISKSADNINKYRFFVRKKSLFLLLAIVMALVTYWSGKTDLSAFFVLFLIFLVTYFYYATCAIIQISSAQEDSSG